MHLLGINKLQRDVLLCEANVIRGSKVYPTHNNMKRLFVGMVFFYRNCNENQFFLFEINKISGFDVWVRRIDYTFGEDGRVILVHGSAFGELIHARPRFYDDEISLLVGSMKLSLWVEEK